MLSFRRAAHRSLYRARSSGVVSSHCRPLKLRSQVSFSPQMSQPRWFCNAPPSDDANNKKDPDEKYIDKVADSGKAEAEADGVEQFVEEGTPEVVEEDFEEIHDTHASELKEPKPSDGSGEGITYSLDESGDVATDSSSVVAQGNHVPSYPQVVVVPIPNRPLFPGVLYPMQINDQNLVRILKSLKRKGLPYAGVFLKKESGETKKEEGEDIVSVGEPGKDQPDADVYQIGIFAQIQRITTTEQGTLVFFLAHRRIAIEEVTQTSPVMMVKVQHLEDPGIDENDKGEQDIIKAYTLEIMSTIKDILKRNPIFKEQLQFFLNNADLSKPSLLADYSAGLTSAHGTELQEILECGDVKERLRKALILLKKELEISKLQENISKQVEENMTKKQREYMLNEQLKMIKRELGLEKDDKGALVSKFTERLAGKDVPEEVERVIKEEMEKFGSLEPTSMEFNLTRNYLDWLTILPWGITHEECFDVDNAEAILNEDHYGLEDVKERILEFIAVGKLSGQVSQGKIICLIGPPGVGKTSIGKSIARALGREFFRFSVGGMSDVAEIKGHRRTYVGSMPGKLGQCLKKTQCSNPVVLIDEIDKIGRGGHQGDPASALLEVLDPEQNSTFMDHYLDVPLDLSKVLFICTANEGDTIPGPLADRMDFIRLSGYVWNEKVHIAEEFLQPQLLKRTGLKEDQITIEKDAISELIRFYCREAGVRNLQKQLEKIYRKAALKLVRGKKGENDKTEPITVVDVTTENLDDFVGKPVFTDERMYEAPPVGVVMGLAWNSMGGSTLYIESVVSRSEVDVVEVADAGGNGGDGGDSANHGGGGGGGGAKGGLVMTGRMGETMKESSQIAYTVAKAYLNKMDPTNDFFYKNRIHLHIPAGATPKDGPSAGVTMITSFLSLALNKPARGDIAMTGEITLTGKVLPIGGVKEKVIAAQRCFCNEVILPKANEKDFVELQDYIKEGISVRYADYYEDVFNIVFNEPTKPTRASPK